MTFKEALTSGLLIAVAVFLGVYAAAVVNGIIPSPVAPQYQGGAVGFNDFYTATQANVQVGPDVSVAVLATSSGRIWANFSNGSSTAVYLCFSGNPCSVGTGILLSASSSYQIGPDNAYTGVVHARAMASTSLMVSSKY